MPPTRERELVGYSDKREKGFVVNVQIILVVCDPATDPSLTVGIHR